MSIMKRIVNIVRAEINYRKKQEEMPEKKIYKNEELKDISRSLRWSAELVLNIDPEAIDVAKVLYEKSNEIVNMIDWERYEDPIEAEMDYRVECISPWKYYTKLSERLEQKPELDTFVAWDRLSRCSSFLKNYHELVSDELLLIRRMQRQAKEKFYKEYESTFA